MSKLHAVTSAFSLPVTNRITSIRTNQSQLREIDAKYAGDDEHLLAEIGYKQELKRTFSTFQIFGIAYSIMGLLPSISSTAYTGYTSGPGGYLWSWGISSVFIFILGVSMSELASAIPTSGGLYFWTYHYAPPKIRVPLSYLIGMSNSMALCSALVSVAYGNANEIVAAVFLQKDGDFSMSTAKLYGVFAACVLSQTACTCLSSKNVAMLQTISAVANTGLIVLFLIALPIGTAKNGSFNSGKFIFAQVEKHSDWPKGWEFILSMLSCTWTIGAFDSVVHMSEEIDNASNGAPIGILGSISFCGVVGFFIVLCSNACMNSNVQAVLDSPTDFPMAQIIEDSLGRKWAIAMMALMAVCQWLMGSSILTALSRQVWAFARDDGLPFSSVVKVVDKRLKVPIRAVIFACVISLLLGCLTFAGSAAANALFTLSCSGNYFAWCTPIFLRLTSGRSRFRPGSFYLGDTWSPIIGWTTCLWGAFVIVMCMFPSTKAVDKTDMNYTVVITCGVWILSIVYFYVYKFKYFNGPKSNLDQTDLIDGEMTEVPIDEIVAEKKEDESL